MNIDDLTLGQIKSLENMLKKSSTLYDRYVGMYVICRSRSEGINAGEVTALDDTGVILKNARRLYYHRPIDKNLSWYEGVAKSGLSESSKAGAPVEKLIVENYSLTVCSEEAAASIIGMKDHEQN